MKTASRHIILSFVAAISLSSVRVEAEDVQYPDDVQMASQITSHISESKYKGRIAVTVINKKVLLTGEVEDAITKNKLGDFVVKLPGMLHMHNELIVGKIIDSKAIQEDRRLEATLNSKLHDKIPVPRRVKAVVANRVAFLHGDAGVNEKAGITNIATSHEGLSKVVITLRTWPEDAGYARINNCKVYLTVRLLDPRIWYAETEENIKMEGRCVNGYAEGNGKIIVPTESGFAAYQGVFHKGELRNGTVSFFNGKQTQPDLIYSGGLLDLMYHGEGVFSNERNGEKVAVKMNYGKLISKNLINRPAAPINSSSSSEASNFASGLGAVVAGVGKGLLASGDPQQAALGQMLSGVGLAASGLNDTSDIQEHGYETSPTNAQNIGSSSIILSDNCVEAERQATEYVEKLQNFMAAKGPSVCQSAKANREIAKIGLQLEYKCPAKEQGAEFVRQMNKMISESEVTIQQSCNDH